MKPITYIALLTTLVWSCTNQNETNVLIPPSEVQEIDSRKFKSDFEKLCKSLPNINIPYSIYCEECCVHPELTENQNLINQYLPEGSSFMGVIEINDDYVSLLTTYPADWIIPAVVVINLDGEIVDEEIFLGGYCGNDFGYIRKQYFHINNKVELLEIDTSYRISYDEETFEIVDTTKTQIENKKFKIDKNGINHSL
jgi:hypothetical protein